MDEEGDNCLYCNILTTNTMNYQPGGIPICKKCQQEKLKEETEDELRRIKLLSEIDQITDNIYLGDQYGAKNLKELKDLNITHVLICGSDLVAHFPNDFIYKKIDVDDYSGDDIHQHFNDTFDFIDKANKVFVHCKAGVSRSATIVIAYIMKKFGKRFEEAYKMVKDKRMKICPNTGFEGQLRMYDIELFGYC